MIKSTRSLLWLFIATCFFNLPFANAQWEQLGDDIVGEADLDGFGRSIEFSTDGNIVVIGADNHDANANTNSGHINVFEYDGSTWNLIGAPMNGEAANNRFGYSVAIDGDGTIVAAGAPYANTANGNSSGYTKIYEWDGSQWQQLGNTIAGAAADENSGWSVSLNDVGNILALGAVHNSEVAQFSGQVRIFELVGSTWQQIGSGINGVAAQDQFGWDVKLSGNGERLIVGTPYNDDNGNDAGHCKIFEFNGTDWVQLGNTLVGENETDWFGENVQITTNGNRIAVGAWHNDNAGSEAGHVKAYDWNGSDWEQLGNAIEGENAFDSFGWSISLSGDGSRIAAGAVQHPGGGTLRGSTRVFQLDGSTWQQKGSAINGEMDNEFSGYVVNLNEDGSRLAIGAPIASNYGPARGHVRIFDGSNLNINELQEDTFSIYPNPVRDAFTISSNQQVSGEISVEIFDGFGRLISTFNFEQLIGQEIHLPSTAGAYFVKVSTSKISESFTLLKL